MTPAYEESRVVPMVVLTRYTQVRTVYRCRGTYPFACRRPVGWFHKERAYPLATVIHSLVKPRHGGYLRDIPACQDSTPFYYCGGQPLWRLD